MKSFRVSFGQFYGYFRGLTAAHAIEAARFYFFLPFTAIGTAEEV